MSIYWIALNSVNGVGPVRMKQLFDRYGSAEEVFKLDQSELLHSGILSQGCIQQLNDPLLMRNAHEQLETAQKTGVSIVSLDSKEYPSYLREIYAPPPVLYVKGDLSVFAGHAVAIVGTRSPTMYGKNAAINLTKELTGHSLVMVSGLARGIDTLTHETCIDNGGRTIAVLGCGIDIVYPSSNRALAERIVKAGALVSEFPLGTLPESYNFPRRNRLISGLSAGTVVIEAGDRSGSLITAHYALQQGRELFAVPGPITSPMSNGTFKLIKDGAIPVRNGNDIIECIRAITASQVMDVNSCPVPKLPVELLADDERHILTVLDEDRLRVDELVERTGRTVSELFCLLLNMELKGLIRQVSGQLYSKV